MAIAQDTSTGDAITPAATTTSDAAIEFIAEELEADAKNDQQQTRNATEALETEAADVSPRPRARTWSIVIALYLVLFIAALDQTIIS